MKQLIKLLLFLSVSIPMYPALFYVYNYRDKPVEFKIIHGLDCGDSFHSIRPLSLTKNTPTTFGSDTRKTSFFAPTEECGVLLLYYRNSPTDSWNLVDHSDYRILNDLAAVNGTGDYRDGIFYIVIPNNGNPAVQARAPEAR